MGLFTEPFANDLFSEVTGRSCSIAYDQELQEKLKTLESEA